MESLFRMRGSGRSSDIETTIVPQLLAEIDGVESLQNVIVIGATNREDLIDAAVMRPGRLDLKIRINRPDAAGAAEIFGLYLTEDLPLDAAEVAAAGSTRAALTAMIAAAAGQLYARTPPRRTLWRPWILPWSLVLARARTCPLTRCTVAILLRVR